MNQAIHTRDNLQTPCVLVTAGASGLGRAIVDHLLKQNHRVVSTYFRSSAEAEVMEAAYPGQLRMVQADLGQKDHRAQLIECAVEHGGVWALINNLGIYPEEWIEDIDTERFEEVFHLTCTVGFDLIKRCIPLIRAAQSEGRRGRIVQLGDSGADRIEARAQATPYHIAKMGTHILTRTFAQRLGPDQITVNMVSPGFLENSVGEPGEPIPMGAPTSFKDILAALDFLLSPGARHVSGANIVVNGAWNLG